MYLSGSKDLILIRLSLGLSMASNFPPSLLHKHIYRNVIMLTTILDFHLIAEIEILEILQYTFNIWARWRCTSPHAEKNAVSFSNEHRKFVKHTSFIYILYRLGMTCSYQVCNILCFTAPIISIFWLVYILWKVISGSSKTCANEFSFNRFHWTLMNFEIENTNQI